MGNKTHIVCISLLLFFGFLHAAFLSEILDQELMTRGMREGVIFSRETFGYQDPDLVYTAWFLPLVELLRRDESVLVWYDVRDAALSLADKVVALRSAWYYSPHLYLPEDECKIRRHELALLVLGYTVLQKEAWRSRVSLPLMAYRNCLPLFFRIMALPEFVEKRSELNNE